MPDVRVCRSESAISGVGETVGVGVIADVGDGVYVLVGVTGVFVGIVGYGVGL